MSNTETRVNGVTSISPSCRKMIQSLKEIVNYPDQEIYTVLKDCNMDPNEAINNLLSQDPFHEVKSKRDKKKESKDTGESRPRGFSNNPNRVNKGGMDRYVGRGGSNQFRSESAVSRAKPAFKKDNVPNFHPGSFSSSVTSGNTMQPSAISNHASEETNISTIEAGEGNTISPHLPSEIHSAWSGIPSQVTLADIVKMGRPHVKASSTLNQSLPNVNNHQNYTSKDLELNFKVCADISHNVLPNDGWPLVDQQLADRVSVIQTHGDSELYADSSVLPIDRTHQHIQSVVDEVWVGENGAVEDLNSNPVESASLPSLNIHEENFGGTSQFDNELYADMNSYQPQSHTFVSQEDIRVHVVSATDNTQHLSLLEHQSVDSDEDAKPVKIPNHLQVQAEQFSHLSFGSFGAGISTDIPEPSPSRQLLNVDESSAVEVSLVGPSDTRNSEYYGDEHLRTTSDGNIHINGAAAGIYDSLSVPEQDTSKQEAPADDQANHQYTYPSSAAGYKFESSSHLNSVFTHSQSNYQIPDHAPFPNAFSNSLPNTILATSVQSVRESDIAYSPFSMTQTQLIPPKYGNASSISSPSNSIPEVLRTGNLSSAQPTTSQTLAVNEQVTGHVVPQGHVALHHHPYSQPNLPLGHFSNMIGYHPYLPPQSFTYLPSSFQQAFSGTGSYHQSLGGTVPPQYKNSVSVTSLPQSAFGGSSTIPGNYALNSPTLPPVSMMSSQYSKDGNPMVSHHLNESPGTWLHELNSRIMSGLPASTYYSSHEGYNNQQPGGGYRQSQQQPAQNMGYSNYYHSQALEHRQQNPTDGGVSQTHQSNQPQHTWHNNNY